MITNITIDSYRTFHDLAALPLKKFNLVVGKNNSGKTSLLEAIFLLIAPNNPELLVRINGFRELQFIGTAYWTGFFHNLNISHPIRLEGEIQLTDSTERRQLTIKPIRHVVKELSSGKGLKPSDAAASDTVGSVVGLEYEFDVIPPNETPTTRTATVIGDEAKYKVSRSEGYEEPLRGIYIGPATWRSQLPDRLSHLKINKRQDPILRVLQGIEPNLSSMELGVGNTVFCDVGLPSLLPLNLLGGGFEKTLAILLAINDSPGGIVLVDEIENGLHSSSLKVLWKGVIEAARKYNVQIVATTHSYECVRAFSDELDSRLQFTDDAAVIRLNRKGKEIRPVVMDRETMTELLKSQFEVR